MSLKFSKLDIPDVILVDCDSYPDNRGAFIEMYKRSEFEANGIPRTFAQESISKSRKNVVRGLHYQLKPADQGKLVTVLSGSIFDVVVDIRKGSPTYSKHVGIRLSADKPQILWVPEGFAHGFMALEDNTTILYRMTKEYSKEQSRGIIWNDPALAVSWPSIGEPILSDSDKKWPRLQDAQVEG